MIQCMGVANIIASASMHILCIALRYIYKISQKSLKITKPGTSVLFLGF